MLTRKLVLKKYLYIRATEAFHFGTESTDTIVLNPGAYLIETQGMAELWITDSVNVDVQQTNINLSSIVPVTDNVVYIGNWEDALTVTP